MDDLLKGISNEKGSVRFLSRVEERLKTIFNENLRLYEKIQKDFFRAKGKMIRPELLYALSENIAPSYEDTLVNIATGIELIHAASIVHDDVIDGEDIRRGKRSLNAKWGSTKAVLFGDLLFIKAFETLNKICNSELMPKALETSKLMCEAELNEDAFRGAVDIGEEEYFSVIGGKTASLFAFAFFAFAKVYGLSEDLLYSAGYETGMAFQILDDVDDFYSKDMPSSFVTLPFIKAYKEGSLLEKEKLNSMLLGYENAGVKETRYICEKYEVFKYAKECAAFYIEKAYEKLSLSSLSGNGAKRLYDALRSRALNTRDA